MANAPCNPASPTGEKLPEIDDEKARHRKQTQLRSARHAAMRRRNGETRISVWVPAEQAAEIRRKIEEMICGQFATRDTTGPEENEYDFSDLDLEAEH